MISSCYVHIPFCKHICHYCGFCHYGMNSSLAKDWFSKMSQEIHEERIGDLSTLYFGGGTPNVLPKEMFGSLCALFHDHLLDDYEWTVECNPEFVTLSQANYFQSLGINRISLGVQTFQDPLLKTIGRTHSSFAALSAVKILRSCGITNLSIDLMFGLPGQTIEDLKNDLNQFFELDIDHLSIYSLQIEENSLFGRQNIQPCDSDLEADMYEMIVRECKKHGYKHYEISSFARNDAYSKHNLAYWTNQDYYGFGCGATGRKEGILWENTQNLKEYIEQGAQAKCLEVSLEDRAYDAIMMALRTSFGLDIEAWEHCYHKDFWSLYGNVYKKYKDDYLIKDESYLRPTEKGMEILNTILVDFLDQN